MSGPRKASRNDALVEEAFDALSLYAKNAPGPDALTTCYRALELVKKLRAAETVARLDAQRLQRARA